jgi:hypothetical protein
MKTIELKLAIDTARRSVNAQYYITSVCYDPKHSFAKFNMPSAKSSLRLLSLTIRNTPRLNILYHDYRLSRNLFFITQYKESSFYL